MQKSQPGFEELDILGQALACWGGKFRLLCGHCFQEVRCDLKSGEYLNDEAHRNAARKFWQNGWRVKQTPICPACLKSRSEATNTKLFR